MPRSKWKARVQPARAGAPGRARFIRNTPAVESRMPPQPMALGTSPKSAIPSSAPNTTSSLWRATDCEKDATWKAPTRATLPSTCASAPPAAQARKAGEGAGQPALQASVPASALAKGRWKAKRDQAVSAGETCPTSSRENALRVAWSAAAASASRTQSTAAQRPRRSASPAPVPSQRAAPRITRS